MKLLIGILTIMFFTTFAHAGFEGINDSTSLKIFNKIQCDVGMTCSRGAKGVFNMDVDVLKVQVTASATSLTAADCGSTIVGGGAFQLELPEASTVLGCRFTFIVNAVAALTVNPDDADQIVLLTDAAGDAISANAIGESITIEAVSAVNWAPVGAEKGTWADVN